MKRKETDPLEEAQREIRQLKSENRSLRKQIKKLNKGMGKKYKNEESEEAIQELPNCPNCGKGFVTETIIVGRSFKKCDVCDFTERRKL